jgi:hypothetical protein
MALRPSAALAAALLAVALLPATSRAESPGARVRPG